MNVPNCLVKNLMSKKLNGIKTKQNKKIIHCIQVHMICVPFENYNIDIAFCNIYANQSCTLSWCKIGWACINHHTYSFERTLSLYKFVSSEQMSKFDNLDTVTKLVTASFVFNLCIHRNNGRRQQKWWSTVVPKKSTF